MKYFLIILMLLLSNLSFAEDSSIEAYDYLRELVSGNIQNFNEGVNKKYYKSGALFMDVTIKDKKPIDIAKFYDENGQLEAEVFFLNGQIIRSKSYYSNGKLAIENIIKDGESIQSIYDEDQKLKFQQFGKDSKIKKIKTYDANGNITFEGTSKEYKTQLQNKIQHESETAESNLTKCLQDETLNLEVKKTCQDTLEMLKIQKVKVRENLQ